MYNRIEDVPAGASVVTIGAFDGVLVAAALDADQAVIATADRAFEEVEGLRVLNPSEPHWLDGLTGTVN